MKQRKVSSITSMMLLVLMPYLFSARMGVAVMASGDHEAPFIRAGQQQQQDHGEDELWEANFTANKRDLAARRKKEQLQQQRDESRKLQAGAYTIKRLRAHKSSDQPSLSPSLSISPSVTPTITPSISSAPTYQPSDSPTLSTKPSTEPSTKPSLSSSPSANPTTAPSISSAPTLLDPIPNDGPRTLRPTAKPTTARPPFSPRTLRPTGKPTVQPTPRPTAFVCRDELENTFCQGEDACEMVLHLNLIHRKGACNGFEACRNVRNTISSCSCSGDQACMNNNGNIGNSSCNGSRACVANSGSIGNLSCNGEQACAMKEGVPRAPIANTSCNGEKACCGRVIPVADNTCNSPFECCAEANCPGGCR